MMWISTKDSRVSLQLSFLCTQVDSTHVQYAGLTGLKSNPSSRASTFRLKDESVKAATASVAYEKVVMSVWDSMLSVVSTEQEFANE